MFESLKAIFLGLVFGASAVLGPESQTIVAGENTIVAAKPMLPSYNAIQVFIKLGELNDGLETAIVARKFGEKETGRIEVQICKLDGECLPMNLGGIYLGKDTYGISFWIQGKTVEGVKFSSVKIYAERTLPNASVRWVNSIQ